MTSLDEILNGPDAFRCERFGTRMLRKRCVERQKEQNGIYSNAPRWPECQDCPQGKRILDESLAHKGKEQKAMTRQLCKVEGCEYVAKARGFCGKHYDAWRAGRLDGFGPFIPLTKETEADPGSSSSAEEGTKPKDVVSDPEQGLSHERQQDVGRPESPAVLGENSARDILHLDLKEYPDVVEKLNKTAVKQVRTGCGKCRGPQMKITCPYCERAFDVDQVDDAELWRERAEIAAKLGPAWRIANEYVDCFRQFTTSRVSLKKRVRILWRMVKLWEACEFEYYGKRYRTDKRRIMEALETVCNREKCGFQNDNYLKRVMMQASERVSAQGMTAKEEQDREEKRRQTALERSKSAAGSEQDLQGITFQEFKKRHADKGFPIKFLRE